MTEEAEDNYQNLKEENEENGVSEQEIYKRLSDLTPGHAHITYKVSAEPVVKKGQASEKISAAK